MSEQLSAVIRERFWAKVRKGSGCWTWTGARLTAGYGKIKIFDKFYLAHRVAYQLIVGPIPADMFVLHRCDNPPCVNPAHLYIGTHADNMQDMVRKGRDPAKTHPEKWKEYGRRLGSRPKPGEKNPRAKLTDQNIDTIRKLSSNGVSNRRIASTFSVAPSTIDRIINGKRWAHV